MNYEMLRARMFAKRVSMRALAESLGISKNALYARFNGKVEFKRSEILKICEVLAIDDPAPYFFADKVS